MANTVHIYKSKSGNYNMSFHHPICRDGSIGKKIHRSLKVDDKSEAERLRVQIDSLLAVASENPSLLPTRSDAISSQKYSPVVIDAFFDCMMPEPTDYEDLREKEIPLPAKGSIPRVLFVGATGVGKSQLIQHLLGTTRENFPMIGAGRTTVSDIEVIVSDEDFSAVVTFYSEGEIRQIVRENIVEACAFAETENVDKSKVASKILVDSDKRFRLNFVLGKWTPKDISLAEVDDEWEDDDGDEDKVSLNLDAQSLAQARSWEGLENCVDAVVAMASQARKKFFESHQLEQEQIDSDHWQQYIDADELDALTEEILNELERRLCAATGASAWPAVHLIEGTKDKNEFLKQLFRFYQNDRKLFGALVTPLVQGVRVHGRFFPAISDEKKYPSWVLFDSQGVGHEQNEVTNINRTIPPELTAKFSDADLICFVDRATPAMTGDAPILLEDLITRGYLDRLAIIFTHFESVKAPDLSQHERRLKVLEGVSSAIQSIGSLPKAQKVLLERDAESKSYFLSKLNQPDINNKSSREEINHIYERIRESLKRPEILETRPTYNEYDFAQVIRKEIEAYRYDWSEGELSRYHYKILEALTNWIGNAYADGYARQRLYPGQNLSQRLISAISRHLEDPNKIKWTHGKPTTEEKESQILNAIRNRASDKIDSYCREILVQNPRTSSWLPAYRNISGPGTKIRRARVVSRILEDRAELPEEGLGKFTKDVWLLVEAGIEEVFSVSTESENKIAITK